MNGRIILKKSVEAGMMNLMFRLRVGKLYKREALLVDRTEDPSMLDRNYDILVLDIDVTISVNR